VVRFSADHWAKAISLNNRVQERPRPLAQIPRAAFSRQDS
jgi:hypothetical protein